MGRPTKIDDLILLPDGQGGQAPRVRWQVIVERVRAGSHPEVAAMSTGVSSTTYYRWKAESEDRVVDGKVHRAKPAYREFREALDRAAAEAEMANVAIILRAAQTTADREGDWKAGAWYLERRAPQRWRRRESTWHGGPGEGDAPLAVDLTGRVGLDADAVSRLDAVLEILEESGALDRRPEPAPE